MRVVYMGTPAFALPALTALIESKHEVVALYSQPPRPAGRGKKLTPSPTHTLADTHNIPVETPTSLKHDDVLDTLASYKPDVIVVAAYGLLLPKAVLEIPKHGCINIHPSLLPRWRGAAPLQHTVYAGDKQTGVCIMQMDEGLDSGDVLAMETVELDDSITSSALHDMCADIGARMTIEVLEQLENGTANATKQAEEGITYASKLTKEDGNIDWNQDAAVIDRQIRALNPWPGTFTTFNGDVIKIHEAMLHDDKTSDELAGTIVAEPCVIACGNGLIEATIMQKAGKQRVSADEFVKGTALPLGTRFE